MTEKHIYTSMHFIQLADFVLFHLTKQTTTLHFIQMAGFVLFHLTKQTTDFYVFDRDLQLGIYNLILFKWFTSTVGHTNPESLQMSE